jgi:hypothetical protein
VVRAADLARLLPPTIGIALNAGASESVPVYPPGVAYLAEDAGAGGADAGATARTHERARLRRRRRHRPAD